MSVATQPTEYNSTLKDKVQTGFLFLGFWLVFWAAIVNLVGVGVLSGLVGLGTFGHDQVVEYALRTVLFSIILSTPFFAIVCLTNLQSVWTDLGMSALVGGLFGGAAGSVTGLTARWWDIWSYPTPLGLASWVAVAGATGALVGGLWKFANTKEGDDWSTDIWYRFLRDYVEQWLERVHLAVFVLTFVCAAFAYALNFEAALEMAFRVTVASLALSTLGIAVLAIRQNISRPNGSASFLAGYIIFGGVGGILALIGTAFSPLLLGGIYLPPIEMASLFVALSMFVSLVGGFAVLLLI